MKILRAMLFTYLFLTLIICALAAPYTVTGQWDFKFGDLRATIGADLQYVGNTSNLTSFTSAKLNGQPAQVMSFGSNSPSQGFYMRHGAKANGGGQFVNQYTIVMDVMYPSGNSAQMRPLVQADPFNHPGTDAAFSVGNSSSPSLTGLGANNQFDGSLAANTWYRIAFAVDLTATNGQQLTKYVNGQQVGAQTLTGGIDGHYALGPTAQLFTSGTVTAGAATQPGYVNSIQFINSCLSSNAITALGGPTALGIPSGDPRLQIAQGSWQSSSTKFSWPGRASPSLQVQLTTNLNDPNSWQTLGNLSATRSLTVPTPLVSGTLGFFRVAGPLPTTVESGLTIEPDITVATLPSGEQSLPTKQILHTPGQSVRFPSLPVDLVLSPDGTKIYLKTIASLVVVDAVSWRVLQTTKFNGINGSMHGIAMSRDGSHVYATCLPNQLTDWAVASNGTVSLSRTIALPTNCSPWGVAVSHDNTVAYVCLSKSNSLAIVNLSTGAVTQQINVGVAPWDVLLSTDGATAYVSDWAGRHPVAGDLLGGSADTLIVVDSRGIAASGTVSFVDLNQNLEVAEVATGLHPSDQALSADGNTLYVANANSDTVSVINTQTRTVQETILPRPDPALPFGSAPDALALSRDGTLLYVANTGNNAVAVFELPNSLHTNSLLQGFIPTDWYPGSIAVDGNYLYAANTKGLGTQGVSVLQLNGTVNKIPLPSAEVLSKYTAQVQENSRVPQMLQSQVLGQSRPTPAPVPVPAHLGEPSVFQHVLYIIKENKTYDQMFGDMTQGNGNSNLCIYPQYITPNHHALAAQYVLLDNYYCNGVYSTDGHSWCTEGNSTAYWEKSIGAINRSSQVGSDPLIYSSSGFIWNNVLQHGLTFRNYGVMCFGIVHPYTSTWAQVYADYTNHTQFVSLGSFSGHPPQLAANTSTNAFGFCLAIPDQIRADGFLKEFYQAQSNGVWAAFNMLYLPNDHTGGGTPGYPTPRAQLADNDLALGRVVAAVTQSTFASNTVIFVIEDDPQGGYDHVDGHRSICLVISPYTKRGQTVSTFFNQTGLLHTMEQILGLPPMNQLDAMGPLMGDCFTNTPDFTPYQVVANIVPLNEMNPGTTSALKNRQERYWARQSLKLDFSQPDLANDDALNRILWHSLKGNARYPSEFVGSHPKNLKQLGLMVAKNHKDDDDD